FLWKSYVSEVNKSWPMDEDNSDRGNSESGEPSASDAGIDTNHVILTKGTNGYVGSSNADDYTFRPHALENVPLYDYFQMSERKKCMAKELAIFLVSIDTGESSSVPILVDGNISSHPFLLDHPLHCSHYICCDKHKIIIVVPNFVGGSLPHIDQGDREFYCCTMLTLFKLWRSGLWLKSSLDSLDDTFSHHAFDSKALKLMQNFNVHYEFNDAHDNY
ncbi:hypothetical protein B0H10DRAFT_1764896, partial [Mycena sp. CBHHK59/15]